MTVFSMTGSALKVLLIEDNPDDCELLIDMLDSAGPGYNIKVAERLSAGISMLGEESFDAILLDLGLPDSSGIETLRSLQRNSELPVVILTGLADEQLALEAIHSGAQDYLVKGQAGSSIIMRSIRYAIERKRSDVVIARATEEWEHTFAVDFLQLINTSTGIRNLVENAASFFQRYSRCEAVGIRLCDNGDYPYFETRGFAEEFLLAENSLCLKNALGQIERDTTGSPVLACMCGNIICGRTDPSKPFFTPYGSFWTNSTTELLASTTESDRQARTRNRCNGEGYESVALIPLSAGSRRLGLLQLNDRRRGMFTNEDITLWERLSGYLAVALSRAFAEESLRKSETRFRQVVESSPVAIGIIAADGAIEYINPKFREVFGYTLEDIPGMQDWFAHAYPDAIYRRYIQHHWQSILGTADRKQRLGTGLEARTTCKDGSVRIVHVSAAGMGDKFLTIFSDLTEQRRLEQQLLQAQKMEAVGQLAGGIAHDFNNILSAIAGYGYLVQTKLGRDNPLQADMQQILEAANRASELTNSLLVFSRKQLINLLPWDINYLIRKSVKLLSRVIGEDIEVVLDLSDEELPCLVDASQIDQVLMNLATNARDAMPKGGRFTLSSRISVRDPITMDHNNWEEVPHALIMATDNGIGMAPDTASRIFDPFFTTKTPGKGTGLGLAIVYGIVNQLGGQIEVESESGRGTTFKIYLPLTESREAAAKVVNDVSPSGGSETILVAEDDDKVRRLYQIVLSQQGYNVISAKDGDEAIRLFAENRDKIRLIMLDMIMPRKSGREVYEAIRKAGTDAMFLFASGYTDDRLDKDLLLKEQVDFIAKPAGPKDLLYKIRQMLDSAKDSDPA